MNNNDDLIEEGWTFQKHGQLSTGERFTQWTQIDESIKGTIIPAVRVYREGDEGYEWQSPPLTVWPTLAWRGPMPASGGSFDGSGCAPWGPWHDLVSSDLYHLRKFVDHLIEDGEDFSSINNEHIGIFPVISLGVRDASSITCLNGSQMPRNLWQELGSGMLLSVNRENALADRGITSISKRVRGLVAGKKGANSVCAPVGPIHAGELSMSIWGHVGGLVANDSDASSTDYARISVTDFAPNGEVRNHITSTQTKREIDPETSHEDYLSFKEVPKIKYLSEWPRTDFRGEFVGWVQFRRKTSFKESKKRNPKAPNFHHHAFRFSAFCKDYGKYSAVRRLYKQSVLQGEANADHATMINLAWPHEMKYLPAGFDWYTP